MNHHDVFGYSLLLRRPQFPIPKLDTLLASSFTPGTFEWIKCPTSHGWFGLNTSPDLENKSNPLPPKIHPWRDLNVWGKTA
mmetsp:Transcript_14023/g.25048  ORF Transcript_14023/g.25048 Transcript_14023/m.25048 type:complete len:81 (+) Transcript_14023:286-528(+)